MKLWVLLPTEMSSGTYFLRATLLTTFRFLKTTVSQNQVFFFVNCVVSLFPATMIFFVGQHPDPQGTFFTVALGSLSVITFIFNVLVYTFFTSNKKNQRVSGWRQNEDANYYFKKFIEIQEKERKKVAHRLHDGVGQNLSILKNKLLFGRKYPENPLPFEEIDASLSEMIEEIRTLSYGMIPFHLELLGLTRSIESLSEEMLDTPTIQHSFSSAPIDGVLSRQGEINLYRIVQEYLKILVKSGVDQKINILITRTVRGIDLKFDVNRLKIKEKQKKVEPALMGIRERVNILEGNMDIKPLSPNDLQVSIFIPIKKHA